MMCCTIACHCLIDGSFGVNSLFFGIRWSFGFVIYKSSDKVTGGTLVLRFVAVNYII